MRELERNSKNWGVLVSDRKNRESSRRKRKKEKGKRENQLKKERSSRKTAAPVTGRETE